MTPEIPTCCKKGECHKTIPEKVKCLKICDFQDDQLPELDCWNNGKGFWISTDQCNPDPLSWNKARSESPGTTVWRGHLLSIRCSKED